MKKSTGLLRDWDIERLDCEPIVDGLFMILVSTIRRFRPSHATTPWVDRWDSSSSNAHVTEGVKPPLRSLWDELHGPPASPWLVVREGEPDGVVQRWQRRWRKLEVFLGALASTLPTFMAWAATTHALHRVSGRCRGVSTSKTVKAQRRFYLYTIKKNKRYLPTGHFECTWVPFT